MADMDTTLGIVNRAVKLNSETYEVTPMGPFLLGEIVAYIKELRRKEIANNARDMRMTDLDEVYKLTSKGLSEDELNTYMEQPEVARMLIWFSLRNGNNKLTFAELTKLVTTENMAEIVQAITGEQPKNVSPPVASG